MADSVVYPSKIRPTLNAWPVTFMESMSVVHTDNTMLLPDLLVKWRAVIGILSFICNIRAARITRRTRTLGDFLCL